MKLILGFLVLLFSISSLAQSNTSDCLTPSEIRASIADFKVRMKPVIDSVQLPWSMEYVETVDVIGAYSQIFSSKDVVEVTVYGTQCHRAPIGPDELQLFMCHELGHSAGGVPLTDYSLITKSPLIMVSAEAQADFYATSSCLPSLWSTEDNTRFLKLAEKNPKLSEICQDKDDNKRGMCMRIAMASLNASLSAFYAPNSGSTISYNQPGPIPTFEGHDPKQVKKTYTSEYPTAQCRLEVYLQGMKCQAENHFTNYTQDSGPLSCAASIEEVEHLKCWYKAEE